jgi:hypothetical protein
MMRKMRGRRKVILILDLRSISDRSFEIEVMFEGGVEIEGIYILGGPLSKLSLGVGNSSK